jgi:hypothetical protein
MGTEMPDAGSVLGELLAVSVRFRDRFKEWPAEVRFDEGRVQTLSRACALGVIRLTALHRIRALARSGPGPRGAVAINGGVIGFEPTGGARHRG